MCPPYHPLVEDAGLDFPGRLLCQAESRTQLLLKVVIWQLYLVVLSQLRPVEQHRSLPPMPLPLRMLLPSRIGFTCGQAIILSGYSNSGNKNTISNKRNWNNINKIDTTNYTDNSTDNT